MINRSKALDFLNEKIVQVNIIKHMYATEALMGGVYDYFLSKGISDLGGTKQEWMMAGLLHDGDYAPEVPEDKQGIQITEWLKELGFEIPDNVAHTMAAHNWENTGVEPKTVMDWTLFCGDSLTGLIVATALVMPDRKLSSVTVESVLKKFKDPSFARGTRRKDIKMSEEKLGLSLSEFIETGLKSMQQISPVLGL